MNNEESRIQRTCVKWFRLARPAMKQLLFAVPNGGARNAATGAVLKAEGVLSGVADLILLIRSPDGRYGSLCIEMKTRKGRQRDTQREWQEAAEKAGNKYVICRSLDEFRHEIDDYLTNGVAPENARSKGRDAHF